MARVTDATALRARYGPVNPRSARKVLAGLDGHCRAIIARAPFAVLATVGADGLPDLSPRGDAPGFIRVSDDGALLIPDRRGNNRLDSLLNILSCPRVAVLFLVPGMDETLRVAGDAEIRDDDDLCAAFAIDGRAPATVLRVTVREAFLQCGRAPLRARLWDPDSRIDRASLPSMAAMLKDQIGLADPAESQAEAEVRYRGTLY